MDKKAINRDRRTLPGFEQLAALVNWRGQETVAAAQLRSNHAAMTNFTTTLQAAYHDASSRQLDTPLQARERVLGLFARMAAAKEPEAVLALQLEITTSLSEAGLETARAWTDMTERLAEAWAAPGREATASEPGSPSSDAAR